MGIRYRKNLFRNKLLKSGEYLTVLTIISSIPAYYSTELPEAWAVIDIDITSIKKIMENIYQVTDSYFSIINSDGTPVVSIGNASIKPVLKGNYIPKSEKISSQVRRLDNSEYLILNSSSADNNWDYIYIEPIEVILKDRYGKFLISIIGATIIIFVLGIFGSFIFSRRIFIPIKKIFEKTNTIKGNNEKLKETDLILNKIDELIEYNNNLETDKINRLKEEIPYPVNIENEIYRVFKTGDIVELQKVINSFRDYYVDKKAGQDKIQSDYLRLYCASEVFIPESSSAKDRISDYRLIFEFANPAEIHNWLTEWLVQAFDSLHAVKKPPGRLVRDICRYIEENLDKDISAKGLWQKFNYHPSSIRKLFREELGMTLKEYVDSKRLEKAKELLVTTNIKINDIAIKTGYSQTQSFIAFFHQNVKCTPLEFRRKNS